MGFKNDKNQSILSSFVITNEMIMEMRRVMAAKCTVNFQGTTFNIFNLVKLVNKMKSESQHVFDKSNSDGPDQKGSTTKGAGNDDDE